MKSNDYFVKLFLFFFPFWFFFPLSSQINLPIVKSQSNVSFRTLNIEDGLSTLFVEYIHQDKYGFIWIATQYGLNLYDGYEMKTFKSDPSNPMSLSSDYVNKVVEDKSGNIWACTIRGLCLYNRANESFSTFFPDTLDINSDNNYILGVEEDSKGLLWVFTPAALFSFDIKTKKFTDYQALHIYLEENWTHYSKFVKRCCEDSSSNVWITSSNGLWRFDRKNRKMKRFAHDPNNPLSISSNDLIAIEKDNNENIWITTRTAGLNRIMISYNKKTDQEKMHFKRYSRKTNKLASDSLLVVLNDNHRNLWITGLNGVSLYNQKNDLFVPFFIKGEKVVRMAESSIGGYWIKTINNFYRFDAVKNFLIEYSDYEGFRNMRRKNFYICNKGCVWTTYEGYGIQLVYSWQNPIKQILKENNLKDLTPDHKRISRLLLDKKDNLWLGTYAGIVKIINFSDGNISDYKLYAQNPRDRYSISNNNILALTETSNGEIWIGSEGGLSKYLPENDNFLNFYCDDKNPKSLQFKYVQDLIEDSRGVLWVLTQNGPNLLDRKTGIFYHLNDYNHSINDDYYTTIAEDSNGSIWLGDVEQGLTRIDFPSTRSTNGNEIFQMLDSFHVKHYKNLPKFKNSVSGNSVISLYTDRNKRLWIGTGNGLNLFLPEEDSFIRFNKDDGLENEIICGIMDDEHGNLWLSSKRGISKLSFAKSTKSSNLKENFRIINFSMADGLQGLEYLEKSFFKSKSGILFFGGFNGFNFFIPDSVKPVGDFPVTYLTKFNKLNKRAFFKKPLYELDTIQLLYSENKFSIEFVGLGYKKNQNIRYRYMLGNYDEDWIECGFQRKASYTSIAPGEYIFKVQTSNEFGKWNDQAASIKIIINPPFWNSWWFKIVSIVFLVCLFISLIKIRERNLISQKNKLELQVKERTLEINNKNAKLQKQQEELKIQNEEIATQRDMLDFQNKSINESILYAKRIQTAVLPMQAYIDEILPENFILFKPRDVVSGDFYWVRQVNHFIIIAVADCTGHGVPGAIMSMLGISLINEIIHKREITRTNQALDELRKQVKQTLRQTGKEGATDSGMDIALCSFDTHSNVLQYSGANNNLYLIQNNKFIEIRADRMPIGYYPKESPGFSNHEIQLSEGDIFYMFTDGYFDQFGGEKGFKYKASSLHKILLENHHKPMIIQKEILEKELEIWMNSYQQTDDILIMGIRV